MQPVKVRIAKKDARNECALYEIRVTREKETSTPASLRPNDAGRRLRICSRSRSDNHRGMRSQRF